MGKGFKGNERLEEERVNNQGYLMKIVEYKNTRDIIVEFQDEYKTKTHTSYQQFKNGCVSNIPLRLGEIKKNNQGSVMKIIKYDNYDNIVVEFQDGYKAKIHTRYSEFTSGSIKNPYHKSVYGVGMVGEKYPIWIDNIKVCKEYNTWKNMLHRCFDAREKEKRPTYKDTSCCNEWLLYENFYEWLHSQENFDKWINGDKWCLDKDILVKGNKIYSPETCCLVPNRVNVLFTKSNANRGECPIGVHKYKDKYRANISVFNQDTNKKVNKHLGYYDDVESGFYFGYKPEKERIIKQVAQEEYNNGNITEECYNAMMNYEVEITD